MTPDMTESEATYAAWLNVLGSDPVREPEVSHELTVMRVVATSTGDSERVSAAYMDVLLALAPSRGHRTARRMTKALVTAARAHMVRYVPGIPLMIEGLDCSPEAVRALKTDRDHYRRMVIENAVQYGSVTA